MEAGGNAEYVSSIEEVEDVQIKYEPRSDGESEDTAAHFFRDSTNLEGVGSSSGNKRISEENSDELFGRSVAAEVALFKESREKRILKAKIFQLLAEYEGPMK